MKNASSTRVRGPGLGALAVGRKGDLYVSNHATEAGAGEVLRIDLG